MARAHSDKNLLINTLSGLTCGVCSAKRLTAAGAAV